jgi:hypothetical protein
MLRGTIVLPTKLRRARQEQTALCMARAESLADGDGSRVMAAPLNYKTNIILLIWLYVLRIRIQYSSTLAELDGSTYRINRIASDDVGYHVRLFGMPYSMGPPSSPMYWPQRGEMLHIRVSRYLEPDLPIVMGNGNPEKWSKQNRRSMH